MRGDLSFAKPPITQARLFLQKEQRRRLLLKKEGNSNAKKFVPTEYQAVLQATIIVDGTVQ